MSNFECIICFENLTDYSVAWLWSQIPNIVFKVGRIHKVEKVITLAYVVFVVILPEITNIVDGNKPDPQPIKRRLSS